MAICTQPYLQQTLDGEMALCGFAEVYVSPEWARQRAYQAGQGLGAHFGAGGYRLFRAPGRTELGGNHTDHNHGLGLGAALEADILAAARPTAAPVIRLHSQGYYTDTIALSDLAPREGERCHSVSLIRGIAAGYRRRGLRIGGFDAYTVSEVPRGAGVSSSAAFEVLVAGILNGLYNDGRLGPLEIARIAQEAENGYFGKPCGLFDQASCALGGCVAMDFQDPVSPVLRRLPVRLAEWGFRLCVVNTGGSHTDNTEEFAACRLEMEAVARFLGGCTLRDIPRERFEQSLPALRHAVGDRAVLRALHFYEENDRVRRQCAALERGDAAGFLQQVRASGRSSQNLLQNISLPDTPREQGIALALALTERFLEGEGAWRVHGGGFAGTIQAYVPVDRVPAYQAYMEDLFGPSCFYPLSLRDVGVAELSDL